MVPRKNELQVRRVPAILSAKNNRPLIPVIHTVTALQHTLYADKAAGKTIGFVPTMGALHEGHLSLLRRAKEENDKVVCSIFVNPTQFNDPKDLAQYPRMPEADLQLLESVHCDYAFLPSTEEIYPNGYHLLDLDFGQLETVMEGQFRPGHFKGMATVVKRLFDITTPDQAYFGEKDFQQLAIIRNMAERLNIPVHIHGCATLREHDGLAMSSRNLLLTPAQRAAAPLIHKGLMMVREYIPHQSPDGIKALVTRYIQQSPHLHVQYFDIVHPDTLESLLVWNTTGTAQGCIAVVTEGPRLIDNVRYDW